jgi:hypothetical protein
MPTTFLRFLGFLVPGDYSTINVVATAQAGPERPVDLMLVLDRSFSMSNPDSTGQSKINSLKIATNGFLGLSNTFSADDQLGMVSFSTRGCGSNGQDSTTPGNCAADVPLGPATSSFIAALQTKVNGLVALGGTNTMEAIRTARSQLTPAFDDPTRATTRKAVLLITDGQPTFLKRDNTTDCQRHPENTTALPSPFNTNGPSGCKFGVPKYPNAQDRRFLYRGSLTTNDSGLVAIPSSGSDLTLYWNALRCARSITGCQTNGAMAEANITRNCGYGNSSCGAGGNHDVVFFSIVIGRNEPSDPQSSVDPNAKCLLARMSNATDILNTATGVVETITNVCGAVFTTPADGDTHADLLQSWPCGAGPCIDPTQQKGKVYIIDLSGNVTAQLQIAFQEIAALLKLRLVL